MAHAILEWPNGFDKPPTYYVVSDNDEETAAVVEAMKILCGERGGDDGK